MLFLADCDNLDYEQIFATNLIENLIVKKLGSSKYCVPFRTKDRFSENLNETKIHKIGVHSNLVGKRRGGGLKRGLLKG